MSVFSEQEPTNPQDLSHYAPRRRGERSGVHLRSVTSSVGETKFDRPFRVDASSSPFAHSASSLDAQLEEAIGESLRRHLDPQILPEPPAFARERPRRNNFLTVGSGIALAVGVAAAVAVLVVLVMPGSRDRSTGSGLAAAMEFVLPRADNAAKSAHSQSRPVLVSSDSNQAVTHEQSDQMLDRFVQWRQKVDAAQHQQ